MVMKWFTFIFLFSIAILRAQDREYIEIYNSIGQADTLKKSGETQAAVERYQKAQEALKKLQSDYPKWNENVVQFRLEYIAEKLQSIGPIAVAPEKVIAEPKAKEIVSTQENLPASGDAAILEQKLVAVQKEKDLLKVAMEQKQAPTGQKAQTSKADLKKLRQLEQDEKELTERLTIAGKNQIPKSTEQPKKAESRSESANESGSKIGRAHV